MAANQEMRIVGCLKAGNETGCVILVTADGKEYSLHGDSLPALGTGLGVSVEGKPMDVDTCMQGTPFEVSSWTLTRERCPK